MSKNNIQIKCPICSNNSRSLIELNKSTILECNNCKLAFTSPLPHGYNYIEEDFHANTGVQFSEFNDLPKRWQKCLKMQINLIQKYVKTGSSILEIGCGDGILLGMLTGKKYKTVGMEPGKLAAQKAINKGLNVINDYFPSSEVKENFECVILSHVLEHIEDPQSFIQTIFDTTNATYLLLVQTNYKGVMPKLLKQGWYGWAEEQHYWHFTIGGIKKLVAKIKGNFQVVDYEFSSMEYIGSRKALLVDYIATVIPSVYDQMHILIQKKI